MGDQTEATQGNGTNPTVEWQAEPAGFKRDTERNSQEQPRARGHWVRAAFISAALWIGLFLAFAFFAPRWLGLAFIVGGFPAVWIAGRVSGLRGRGDWIRAAVLGLAITWVGGGLLGVFLTMAIYG
jgi:hypothetical protein